jgi:ElaB/YqjD/DUF883 family membrane-anchored ribosome-binding protein
MSMLSREAESVAASPELTAIKADLAALRQDMATLASHLRSSAVNAGEQVAAGARSRAETLGAEARTAYDDIAAQGERSAKTLLHTVEQQPMMSLMVVFALGFLGSRLVRAAS